MNNQREYTFEQAAALLHAELPEIGFTRNMVYNWVVKRGLAEYRSFPRSPTNDKLTYRINDEGLEKLLEVGRIWLRQAKGVPTDEQH